MSDHKHMSWDESILTGTHSNWSWVVVRGLIDEIRALVTKFHTGERLCITAFDSGSITPSPEEQSVGWALIGDVMVSPPLTPKLHIPSGEYDEWYVFQSRPAQLEITERYVNVSGFTLADASVIAASQNTGLERSNYDWLAPMQSRFWSDMERLSPVSYIASGEVDIVVSRNTAFVDCVVKVAARSVG